MHRLLNSRTTWLIAGGVCLLAAVIAFGWADGLAPRDILMRGLRKRLGNASPESATAIVSQMARIDEPGAASVVALLGSRQQHEALAARDVLRLRIAEWRTLSARESTPHVAALARHLVHELDGFGPAAKRAAGEFASQIVSWPVDRQVVDVTRLLSDCEAVLAAAESVPGARFPVRQAVQLVDEDSSRRPTVAVAVDDAGLPGGGLPSEPVEIPERTVPKPLEEPGLLPITPEPMKPMKPIGPAATRPLDAADPPREFPLESPGPTRRLAPPAPLDSKYAASLQRLADVEVMQLLHNERQALALAAIEELKRRGFQARHLRLAMRLTSPDPSVRRQLARDLTKTVEIDVRPWIVQLSRDEDLSVRDAAVALMSGSEDEKLLTRLREMRSEESGGGRFLPASATTQDK